MCPMWLVYFIFKYFLMIAPLWAISFGFVGAAAEVMANSNLKKGIFDPAAVKQLLIGTSETVRMTFKEGNKTWPLLDDSGVIGYEITITDPEVAVVSPEIILKSDVKSDNSSSYIEFNVTGQFLGYANACVSAVDGDNKNNNNNNSSEQVDCLPVSVIRKPSTMDKAFTASVAILVSLIYINMGAALDLSTIKETLRKPYGPVIGIFSQFVVMPLLSFGIGKLLLRASPVEQLGLFLTGCSPGGGASNIWTLTLGGNLDLSVTMTTISTLSAFVMMPAWILTLGSTIFEDANLTVPYTKIATFAISLIIPLLIGIVIQRCSTKVAKFLVKYLKIFALVLIVYIVIFAIYINFYLLQLLSLRVILAGILLPWLGYFVGGGLAMLAGQRWEDVIAIGIETGVQNTGLSIFALRLSLPQPDADLTTVLPVAVAIMTPIIPGTLILIQKVRERLQGSSEKSGLTLNQKEDSISPLQQDSSGTSSISNGNGVISSSNHV